jgi:hypothetical protein
MERLYSKVGLPIKYYPCRGMLLLKLMICVLFILLTELGERIPPRVTHPSESEQIRRLRLRTCPPRPLKRSYAMLGMCSQTLHLLSGTKSPSLKDIEARPAPTRQKTVVKLLAQLDARVQPGITDTEFSALFRQCECGMVTTRGAFSDHKCIIDLSGDD